MGIAASAAGGLCECAFCCAACVGAQICGCTMGIAAKFSHTLMVVLVYLFADLLADTAPDEIRV